MSNNNTKSGGLDAKKTGLVAQEFNSDNRLGAAIANASPEAREAVQKQMQLTEQVLERKMQWQSETREARIETEQSRMWKQYMNDPVERLNTPEARQNDMKIIEEQSERKVDERDRFSLENIKREAKSYVYQILRNDREQSQQHSKDHDHDQGY